MSKNQFTGTATQPQPQRIRNLCHFNNDQYCTQTCANMFYKKKHECMQVTDCSVYIVFRPYVTFSSVLGFPFLSSGSVLPLSMNTNIYRYSQAVAHVLLRFDIYMHVRVHVHWLCLPSDLSVLSYDKRKYFQKIALVHSGDMIKTCDVFMLYMASVTRKGTFGHFT